MSGSSGSFFSQVREFPNGIPPVLLQNFNAYEILEPKKVEISNPSTLNEELLIDFESPVEANRTVKKEEEGFTVIDAFQNIYVTPQLVSNKPKTTVETDVDLQDFFCKVECSNKVNWTQNSQAEPAQKSLLDIDFAYFENNPESPPKFLTNNNYFVQNVKKIEDHETDAYQEELIEEVLLNRTLEKQKLSYNNIEDSPENLRVLSTPKIFHNANSQAPLYKTTNLVPQLRDPETQYSKPDLGWRRENTPTDLYYGHDENDAPKINKSNYVNLNVLGLEYPSYNHSHSATASKILNNSSNIGTSTIGVGIDNINRLVSKQSFQTNQDYIKSCFTTDRYCDESKTQSRSYEHDNTLNNRAEDIFNHEKTLNSLKLSNNVQNGQIPDLAKNIYLTPQQSHHATHIHDYIKLYPNSDQSQSNNVIPSKVCDKNDQTSTYGANATNHSNVSQPKITNSNHLRNFKSAVNDSQPKSFITDMTTLTNLTINPVIMKTVPVQEVIKDSKDFAKNRITKSDTEKLKFTKGPDFHEKSIVLPQLLRQMSIQKQERDAKNNVRKRLILYPDSIGAKTGHDRASVVLEPTILMEDCNRERIIALKTRQRLTNLVQNGH